MRYCYLSGVVVGWYFFLEVVNSISLATLKWSKFLIDQKIYKIKISSIILVTTSGVVHVCVCVEFFL